MRIALVILFTLAFGAEAAPVMLGLHHARHGLDEKQQGRMLISELRCVACHADDGIAKKVGPNLLDVGWRVDSLFLKKFIVNPAGMDPGTQMPNLLEHLPKAGFNRLASADGAFYIYADITHLTNDSDDFCRGMLAETGVAAAPGIDFDPARGNHFLRFSFAGPTDEMAKAVRRLQEWNR